MPYLIETITTEITFGLQIILLGFIIRFSELLYHYDHIMFISPPMKCKKCHKKITLLDCKHNYFFTIHTWIPPIISLMIILWMMFSIYPSSNYQQLIEFNLNHPEKPIPDYDPYHKFETIQSKLIEIYEGIN